MIPVRDSQVSRKMPLVTYTIIALNIVIFLWDRQGRIFGGQVAFGDLAMRPSDIMGALFGGADRFPLVTVFTSMFLHMSVSHIVGNMLFLYVFGETIEFALGSPRFALYYLFWGVMAAAAHIYVMPGSTIPTLGASGAIGGVLGSYFLLFPANKVEVFIPFLAFLSIELPAWILLGCWFLWQILIPQQGVANWAHAGGFLAGMLTVLIMGGRAAILRGREQEFEDES